MLKYNALSVANPSLFPLTYNASSVLSAFAAERYRFTSDPRYTALSGFTVTSPATSSVELNVAAPVTPKLLCNVAAPVTVAVPVMVNASVPVSSVSTLKICVPLDFLTCRAFACVVEIDTGPV